MEIVEQLLGQLEDLFHVINKTYENFKKSSKVRLTRGYLTVKLQSIEEYWSQFRNTHNELLKNVKKDQRKLLPYFTQDQYFVCEEVAMQAKTDMNDALFTLMESQQKATERKSLQGSSITQQPQVQQVKLPRIEIPKFCGNYEAWPTFQDLFISLVDRNNTISDVQKLHYLKTSVGGEAELLLRHIQINEANYKQAWEALKRRYSNKRLIVTSLLKRMFSQRKLSNQNSNNIKCLIDTTSECLNSLKNMDIKTDDWDPLINFILVQKLDVDTHKEWEEHVSNREGNELPSFETLKIFLEAKFRTLELVQQPALPREKVVRSYHISDTSADIKCPMCNENHALYHCKDFGKIQPEQRTEFVKSRYICYNCLVPGHRVGACRLLTTCRLCKRRHHTLLHVKRSDAFGPHEKNEIKQPKVLYTNVEERTTDEEINLTVMTSQTQTAHSTAVALLATALVECKSEDGHTTVLRALIDPGSQGCFISQRAAQAIRAKRYPVRGNIVGIGDVKSRLNQVVQLEVASRSEKFSLKVKAYVISKQLTTQIPTQTITTSNWSYLEGLKLADPTYNQPANIDLLLGVNEYAQIIQNDVIKGPPGSPSAQKTTLGWILFGEVNIYTEETEESILVMHHQVEVDDMLKTLWEIDTDTNRKLTKEEENCENMYKENYTRTEEGRYRVKLPFKTETPKSLEGNTQNIAMKRLQMLERRFERQPDLKRNYTEVIDEYIRLNHMQEVPQEDIDKKAVYLPHHAVVRAEKETTKTRVVFDASCKGTNGISLNDELMIGPVLQEDLRSIIMRWRMHKICFVSDIEKMYRMILVNEKDTDFQRVLWTQNTSISDEVKHYRLMTVTFGTASAPYLAVKTLMQLAEDEGQDYPLARKMIREDFYVDDLMSGCDTVQEAIEASIQLKTVLNKGQFRLQKWCSNNTEFLKSLDKEDRSSKAHIDMKLDGTIEINIVAARTKVAPVKTVSMPRLELCAAVLLSKLLSHTARAMRIAFDNVFAFTDSSVVLSWLFGEPQRWKQFVANRVVEIADNVPISQWHHVQTDHNPADIASRGEKLSELKHNNLWWHGPHWLSEREITFTKLQILPTNIEQRKNKIISMNIIENKTNEDKGIFNFENYDNLEELLKIIIYLKRFLNYKRSNENKGAITTTEIDKALKICIRKAQREDFGNEIEDIEKYKRVKGNSKLKSLNPYLDEEQILRVGGRLRHANLEKDAKHPMILSNKNPLTLLIVAHAHQKTLHGGLQLMLCHLRSRFWILRAKNIVKKHIHKCIICARANAKARTQVMGDLPNMRVNRARPFLYSGVDFAGPFNVLMSKGRGAKSKKAYISIFICMCTKAIHLELVGDLTSEAFIAAFRRFVARRGRCAHIYSDQGRNFVGANKELVNAWKVAQLEFKDDIAQTLALDGTQWHFIPPYSPNFGGLWEAGVKSVKSHLKKVLISNLTFEEMTTLLCQSNLFSIQGL